MLYNLSLGQKELWYIHALEGTAEIAYNEHLIYALNGDLSINTLKSAFAALIDKHPILRVSFEKDNEGNLYQKLHEKGVLDFIFVEHNDKDHLNKAITELLKKPFIFKSPSLMRIGLFKLAHNEFRLVIVLHHIIVDGTSFSILINDLNTFYNQLLQGFKIDNIIGDKNYFEWIAEQEEYFLSRVYEEKVKKIADNLRGYSRLNYLTPPGTQNSKDLFSGNRVYFSLDSEISVKLLAFAKVNRVTLYHVLYAVYSILLNRYTNSRDMVIGVPFANRSLDLNKEIIGYFINTIPVRLSLHQEDSFIDLINRVKSLIFSSLCNQEVCFEHLERELKLGRNSSSQHPLIQSLFVLASLDKIKLKFEGIDASIEHNYHNNTAKFDLSLFMFEENNSISAYFEYRDAIFEISSIEQIILGFKTLLKNTLTNPLLAISSFSILDDITQSKMKKDFFKAKLNDIVTTNLAGIFSATARKHQKRIGLIFNDKRYTYEEIEERSNKWANYIKRQYYHSFGTNLPPDTLVALYIDRCEDMIFGILGILKSGAAYVPIDPEYPANRINYIINHSKAALLLTHRSLNKDLEFDRTRIVYMDEVDISFEIQEAAYNINPKSLAYVLYTSGSTGQPKGVGVTHENVICLFESLKKQFSLSHNDVWSLFHTFCFDISVWEIWGAFYFGGSLVVIPYEISRDPRSFYQLIKDKKVSVLTQTASAFQMFINEDLKTTLKLEDLRYISFVGESLKVSILRPWVKKYGAKKPRLANMYGITETTVYTNNKFIDGSDIEKNRDNIGWPLEQFSMCIMDENLQWCGVGVLGEICIGGRGLSRGYLYREELTREKFISDPYREFLGLQEDALLYRTGDLGRWLPDGSIEYLGRKDFQVKLRGFRIELGEIESALGNYKNISHTAVLLKGEGDSAYLAAFYTVEQGSEVNTLELSLHLKSLLPEYMIPTTFTKLASFPMTVNGKIDRKALYECEDKGGSKEKIVTLQSDLEHKIADIWAEILNIDVNVIGAASNFFELGGNSLLVIKLLTLLSNRLQIELTLSQFLASPTILTINSKEPSLKLLANIKKDIILNLEIHPLKDPNPNIFNPKTILITGVTGFLGAHMLYELLTITSAKIYCLIRGDCVDNALRKIQMILKKYHLLCSLERVVPILGDLTEVNLGLASNDYIKICNEVDAIYHVGALVHHVYDYDTLYKSNVMSVNELLVVTATTKNKSIHFVSTLATELISPLEKLPLIAQGLQGEELNLNGYLTTKWVAEKLLKEAQSRRLAAYIYRPGNIIAGAHGIYEPHSNHTLLRLKGLLQLEKGYVSEHETVEMLPVDLLAQAIIKLSFSPESYAYNLNNAYQISWVEYLNIAKKQGYHFEFIHDPEEWNVILDNLDEENGLYKLAHIYKIKTEIPNHQAPRIIPNYKITVPSYEEMVMKQLKSLNACGFLPKPVFNTVFC